MSSLRLILLCLALTAGAAAGALAQGLTALARVDAAASSVRDEGTGLVVELALSQPVPWRAYTLERPRRLVIDFSEARFDAPVPVASPRAGAVSAGPIQPGWSRMVLELGEALAIEEAGLDTSGADGRVRLTVRLAPVSAADFAAASGAPPDLARTLPEPVVPAAPPKPEGRLRVVLDPGHGGIDPGAEYEGLTEADLMLTFARELRELLVREGFDVAMTRDADVFVPLEARVSFAREAEADLFLSLHADSLPEEAGSAHGATVYVLSEEASDVASRRLAERHDGSDLVAGVDVTGQGDEIALVLMEMARVETEPGRDRAAHPPSGRAPHRRDHRRGGADEPPPAPVRQLLGPALARGALGPPRTRVPVEPSRPRQDRRPRVAREGGRRHPRRRGPLGRGGRGARAASQDPPVKRARKTVCPPASGSSRVTSIRVKPRASSAAR